MTSSTRKKIIGVAIGAAIGLSAPAAMAHNEVFVGTLSELTESTHLTPPSAGTGSVTVTINEDNFTMRVQATFSGLTGLTSAAHIHCCTGTSLGGFAGVATQTPTFTTFPLNVREGSMDQSFDMTQGSSWNASYVNANGGSVGTAFAAFVTGVKAGQAYFNVHTSLDSGGVPGGEIRAFLVAAPVPEPASYALMVAGLGLVGAAAAKRRKR